MLTYLLESSIGLAIFYTVYHIFLRNDTFFQRNRVYLLLSSALACLIPIWEIKWLTIDTEQVQTVYSLPALTVGVYQAENQLISDNNWFINHWFWIYGIVAILLFLHFAWQIGRLIWFIRHSERKYCRGYRMIHTDGKLPTFSFINYLFWDNTKDLNEAEADKVVSHELKHIFDKHSYDVLYIELLKIVFWFNPAVYLYSRALKFQHEYIADASVLRETDTKSYSSLLVRTLFKNLNLPLAHGFNKSEIQQRIKIMQKLRTSRRWYWKTLLALPLLVVFFFVFAAKIKEKPLISLSEKNDEMNRFVDVEGGLDNFYQKLSEKLQYPASARMKGIEGRVFVQFTVNQDGSLSDFKVSKGLEMELDQIAIEAVKNTEVNWLPAKVDGKEVKQQISLPVFFKLKK